MNQVITAEQAKKITGHRELFIPVEFTEAIRLLKACRDIDSAKYWSNYADAYEAWARIKKSDIAIREAKALKLHAFREMHRIASILRPNNRKHRGPGAGRHGSLPGAKSLLKESGLTASEVAGATVLGRLSQNEFDALISRPRPPSPTYVGVLTCQQRSCAFGSTPLAKCLADLDRFCAATPAAEAGRSVKADTAIGLRARALRLGEWLDEFERHLPKGESK